jgi:hypothetical protein
MIVFDETLHLCSNKYGHTHYEKEHLRRLASFVIDSGEYPLPK